MVEFTYNRFGLSIVAIEGKFAINGVLLNSFELSELQEALEMARRTVEFGKLRAKAKQDREREVAT